MKANLHGYHVRKWLAFVEDTLANETGELADGAPVRKILLGAVVKNPYAGKFSANLDKLVENSSLLGAEFGRRLVDFAGDRKSVV